MMNLYKNRGGTPEEFVQVSSSLFLVFRLVLTQIRMCKIGASIILEEIWPTLYTVEFRSFLGRKFLLAKFRNVKQNSLSTLARKTEKNISF